MVVDMPSTNDVGVTSALLQHTRWTLADATLRARTGMGFWAHLAQRGRRAVEDLVAAEHDDLAEDLGIFKCACGKCDHAGTRMFMWQMWSEHHVERVPVSVRWVGLGYEVRLGFAFCGLEDAQGHALRDPRLSCSRGQA